MTPGTLAAPVVEAVLRDGLRVNLRRVIPEDEGAILLFLTGLAPESIYRRFFSLRPELGEMARRSVRIERGRVGGVIALVPPAGPVTGHAGYWRTGSGVAELALVVADCWRNRGLGRLLLGELMRVARGDGVRLLEMDVLVNNEAGIGLLRTSGAPFGVQLEAGVLHCELELTGDAA